MGFLELRAIDRKKTFFFDLGREGLVASGLDDENRISEYLAKLDTLYQNYRPKEYYESPPLAKARAVFESLWKDRPGRYIKEGPFRLNEVIDAQLDRGNPPVGNCLGLTLLYNSLLKRMGLEPQALYLEYAFETGPHVLTLLRIGNTSTEIENILSEGFDYKGHKENPCRMEWGDKELVADIYQSVGTECFLKKAFREALRNYDLALNLYPEYEKAKLNRTILLDRIAMKGQWDPPYQIPE